MANDTLFRQRAPLIMRRLMTEFGIDATSAAAIVGNLGHESAGFKSLQEIKPLVPGSRGGYGYAQWTGPRRVAYEKFCTERHLDPASHEANVGFLIWELRNTEKTAIPAVKRAASLHDKVVAFELAFERASPQHKGYASRESWANTALLAYNAGAPTPAPKPAEPAKPSPPIAAPPKPADKKAAGLLMAIGLAIGAAWTWFLEYLPEIMLGLVALIALAAVAFRFMKGHWPWQSISTGVQSQAPLPLSPPSSAPSSEQLSAARLALLSVASPEVPLPQHSAQKRRRKRSAKPSPKTRKRPTSSRGSRSSGGRKSLRKRKPKSRARSSKG